MDSDRLNRWLTLAANFGVIVGIFFLAWEIRGNTRTQQQSAAQQVLGLSFSNAALLASSPTYGDVTSANNAGEALTEEQEANLSVFYRAIIAAFWQVHYQYQNDFLPDNEIFDAYERRTIDVIKTMAAS